MSAAPLRLLVADDHPAIREGLRAMLEGAAEDLVVVGEAASGTEAVRLAEELAPDVVLMDVRMPEVDGIEATRRIVTARPGARVVVLTMSDDDGTVFAAMRAGARGFLLKDADRERILLAVRAVSEGEALLGAEIADRLAAWFDAPRRGATAFPQLSEREREVLELVATGRSNAAIADELVLSLKTVRNHVSNLFTKLQVVDRAGAIVKAREAGVGGR